MFLGSRKAGHRPVSHLVLLQLHRINALYWATTRKGLTHGPKIYKDTKPKKSSLLVFNRVYRLEIQSVMLVFSTPLVN